MSNELYRWISPDNYYEFATKVSSFGGPSDVDQNPPEYAYGGSSITPEGKEDPEDVIALPAQFVDSGVVRQGQRITVRNPVTGEVRHPILKEKGPGGTPEANQRGADLLTHTFKSMGFNTDDEAIIDLRPWIPEETAPAAHQKTPESEGLQYATTGDQVDSQIAQAPKIAGEPTAESIQYASEGTGTPDESQEPQPAESVETSEEADIPPPSGDAHLVKRRSDGTKIFSDGSALTPDGTMTWNVGGQSYQFNPKFMDKPKATKSATLSPVTQKTALDWNIPMYDDVGKPRESSEIERDIMVARQSRGVLPPEITKEAEQIAQRYQSSRNPYITDYLKVLPNATSAREYLSNPNRNGIDDMLAIQAIANIEAPGRSSTGHDFEMIQKTAGLTGNLEVAIGKYRALIDKYTSGMSEEDKAKQGRILSDEQARQILNRIPIALQPRYDKFKKGMEPAIRRLKQLGVDPNDYMPDMEQPSTGKETTTDTATPTSPVPLLSDSEALAKAKRIKATSNNPDDIRKADAVIARLQLNE